jgi:hypothetical protein
LNQLLQDSWAALADKYCDTKGSISWLHICIC